jgi:dCMP deaminase
MLNKVRWFCYFKDIAYTIAKQSKDPRKKVGAIIVDLSRKLILGTGYNGMPPGYPDENFDWEDKKKKWRTIVHAEANSLLNSPINLKTYNGYLVAFCTLKPCLECTKLLISAGIKEIYYFEDYDKIDDTMLEMYKEAEAMAWSCNVLYEKIN